MAQDSSNKLSKIEISFFDGLNSIMASNVAKKEEFMHSENVRSVLVGTADKREGQEVLGTLVSTKNYGIFYYFNDILGSQNLFRISTVGGIIKIYYLNSSSQWAEVAAPFATFLFPPESYCDTSLAEGNLYIVDINNPNRYISDNVWGTFSVYNSAGAGDFSPYSNVYGSPNANLINYYKERLYIADYMTPSGERKKSSILVSSPPLGIISLVYSDVAITDTTVPVTSTKFFIAGEVVEVYRGNLLITVFTVASVGSDSIVRNHNIVGFNSCVLNASDDIWVRHTFSGKRVVRWSSGPLREGENVGDFNGMKLSGTDGNEDEKINLMENVGNIMFIASSNNIATWNDYVLQTLDLGIGCVSNRSFVKCSGALYFLHYSGVFMTAGDMPKLISTKVERYLSGATKAGFDNSCAGKKGRNIFFTLGDVTLYKPDGSFEKVLPDVVLEYSLTQDNWYTHTNVKADMFATWINDTDFDSLVAITRNSNLPVVEFLKKDVAIDIDEEIYYRFDTKNMMLSNSFEKIAYPQEVCIEMERGKGLKVFVSLDMGDWYELPGECSKGSTILKLTRKNSDVAMPVRCRNIRFSLRHNYKQLCKVSKLAVIYLPTNEDEINKEDYGS